MSVQDEGPDEPDLTLLEADIRGVATVVELTMELRKLGDRLDWLHQELERQYKVLSKIALGLGV